MFTCIININIIIFLIIFFCDCFLCIYKIYKIFTFEFLICNNLKTSQIDETKVNDNLKSYLAPYISVY